MKKYTLLLIIFMGGTAAWAQDAPNIKKGERIQSLKIAFITQKLELTSEEAQSFWPIYNRYEGDLKLVNSQNKGGDIIDNEEKVLNVRKRYRVEFVKVIGQTKMNNLFHAEREFRGALLRRLRNQQTQQRQQNRKAF